MEDIANPRETINRSQTSPMIVRAARASTNLIAVRLNLSENVMKMHIQHIMKKVLRWN
jgi:DNA-binding NarL/FixJ family response regulator